MQSGVRIKMEYPDIVGYIVGQYFVCGETKDSRISKEWSETSVSSTVEMKL